LFPTVVRYDAVYNSLFRCVFAFFGACSHFSPGARSDVSSQRSGHAKSRSNETRTGICLWMVLAAVYI
jgi:hypothetical protein